jgi:hypothetical protein
MKSSTHHRCPHCVFDTRSLVAIGGAVLLLLAAFGCGKGNLQVSNNNNSQGNERQPSKPAETNTAYNAREQLAKLNIRFPDDFIQCVQNNDTLAVRLFLEANINTEQRDAVDDWTPLMLAAYKGNLDMVQMLLDHGADVFAYGRTEEWTAAKIADTQGFSAVLGVLKKAERKFAESLAPVPGRYCEVPTNDSHETNRWEFNIDGSFRRLDPERDEISIEGRYYLREQKVFLTYRGLDGETVRDSAQFTVKTNGLDGITARGMEGLARHLIRVSSVTNP